MVVDHGHADHRGFTASFERRIDEEVEPAPWQWFGNQCPPEQRGSLTYAGEPMAEPGPTRPGRIRRRGPRGAPVVSDLNQERLLRTA